MGPMIASQFVQSGKKNRRQSPHWVVHSAKFNRSVCKISDIYCGGNISSQKTIWTRQNSLAPGSFLDETELLSSQAHTKTRKKTSSSQSRDSIASTFLPSPSHLCFSDVISQEIGAPPPPSFSIKKLCFFFASLL